ncbi:MAG TPA: mechanosensitive ion channel domain-containing protein [Rhizomicrobium sp.]|nr:mechanosensitive ion channel domain-containing protein [Rhizomicrobium sp.]
MNFSRWISAIHGVVPWAPAWLIAAGVLAGVLILAFAMQDILMRVAARHVARAGVFLQMIFRRTRGVVRFGLVLLAVSALTPLLPLPATTISGMQSCLVAAFVVLIGWIALVAAHVATDSYLGRLKLDVSDNLLARKAATQVRVLRRALDTVILLLTAGFALMTFESVRQFGISIFASAGAAGIVLGLAATPVLSNLIAGVQIAITQPIRLEDAVVVEGEWGWVEELTATYVVVRLWDRRRLILPLSYFLQKPFQNWTRTSASVIGTVMLHLDHTAPIARIRAKLEEIVRGSKLWDKDVVNLQVTDTTERTIEVRALVSAANSPSAWDLRCEVREKLLAFIQAELPFALPRRRNETLPSQPELVRDALTQRRGAHAV